MKTLVIALVLLTLSALAIVPAAKGGANRTVVATNYEFTPSSVRISRGASVVWRFRQGAHNVVGRGWGSARIRTSGSYRHRFNRSGRYTYRCTIHPGMDGVVRVR